MLQLWAPGLPPPSSYKPLLDLVDGFVRFFPYSTATLCTPGIPRHLGPATNSGNDTWVLQQCIYVIGGCGPTINYGGSAVQYPVAVAGMSILAVYGCNKPSLCSTEGVKAQAWAIHPLNETIDYRCTNRIGGIGVMRDGSIYVLGGLRDFGDTSVGSSTETFCKFDTATGTWQELPDIPRPMVGGVGAFSEWLQC